MMLVILVFLHFVAYDWIVYSLAKEVSTHNSRNCIEPHALYNQLLSISNFTRGRQEDAEECVAALLNQIDHELGNSNEWQSTMIHGVFGGWYRNEVKCETCKISSMKYDRFLCHKIEIENNVESVAEGINSSAKAEELEEYDCEICQKKVTAEKQLTIARVPNALILQLKRFGYSQTTNSSNKIKKPINLDRTLIIHQSEGEYNNDGDVVKNVVMDLVAVLVHDGESLDNGHYIAYVLVCFVLFSIAVHLFMTSCCFAVVVGFR